MNIWLIQTEKNEVWRIACTDWMEIGVRLLPWQSRQKNLFFRTELIKSEISYENRTGKGRTCKMSLKSRSFEWWSDIMYNQISQMHPNKHIGYLKSNLCKNFTLCIYIAQCARVYFSASLPNIPWKEAALNCVYIVYFVLCILCILHCQVAKYHLKQGCSQLEVTRVEEINSFQVKSSFSPSGHLECITSAQPM